MTKEKTKIIHEWIIFALLGVMAGVAIGIAGIASILASSLYGSWGKLIGAVLFPVGIFTIVAFEFKLFTGLMSRMFEMKKSEFFQLPLTLLANLLGVAMVAFALKHTNLKEVVFAGASQIIANKMAGEGYLLNNFFSSLLCGFLITLSVLAPKYAPKKGLSVTIGVMLPILIFAFCGFDHSIANLFYFCVNASFNLQIFLYELVCVIGNVLGGLILPLIIYYKQKIESIGSEK